MKHKLIIENWRKYLSEQHIVMTGDGVGAAGPEDLEAWRKTNMSAGDRAWEKYKEKLRTGAFRQPYGNEEADTIESLEQQCQKGNKRKCQLLQRMKDIQAGKGASKSLEESGVYQLLWDVIAIFDPTRITAYPEAAIAIVKFKRKQNWYTATMLSLSLLAVIPVVGNFAKIAKVASRVNIVQRQAQILDAAGKIQKTLKAASHAPKIAGYGTKIETARGVAEKAMANERELSKKKNKKV